jgi:hypothetical protein
MKCLGTAQRPVKVRMGIRRIRLLYTSCIMALSSSSGRNEKPWTTATRKVPPGGSWPGLRALATVRYSPVS